MRKLTTYLICAVLALAMLLCACDQNDNGGGEVTRATKATTTPADTTAPATTAGGTDVITPKDLTAKIIKDKQIIGRHKDGVEVEIYNGVTIKLDYQGWPTICKGDGDTIYAAASLREQHIDPFGVIAFYKSEDGGKSWSDVKVIIDTPLDDRDAGITYLGNGKLALTWFTHSAEHYRTNEAGGYTKWHDTVTKEQKNAIFAKWDAMAAEGRTKELIGGGYIAISNDYGETWGEPIRVPINAPHGLILLNDGKTLGYMGKPHYAAENGYSEYTSTIYYIESRDYGKTWRIRGEIPVDHIDGWRSARMSEAHVLQLKDGSFIGVVRAQPDDDNSNVMYITRSANGTEWSPIELIECNKGGAPGHLMQLKNGAILLTYGYRWRIDFLDDYDENSGATPEVGARARYSWDGGKTWSEEIVLTRSDTLSGDLGYASTVELDDGTLVTAYYQRYRNDTYASFLYTTWTLK